MMSNKKPPKQKTRKKILVIVMILSLVIVAGAIINMQFQRYLDTRDRQRFELVKGDIDTLTDRLNEINEEVQWKTEANCRRSHHVWGEGDAGCRISTTAIVPIGSERQTREFIGVYTKAFEVSTDLFRKDGEYGASDYSPEFPKELKPGSSGQSFWSERGDMVCGSLFEIEDTYGDPPSDELKMSFACNDVSRDTWFSRSDVTY